MQPSKYSEVPIKSPVFREAPALGGVAAGRLYDWIADEARTWLGDGILPRVVAAVVVLALGLLPLRIARATASAYLPSLDSAWAETIAQIRDTTPPDTVVSAWWDYGYWIKFLGERRVHADGGSLRTAVPYWLARAQLASSEAEALGVLRMLACGSDARPYPEGDQGAMARLHPDIERVEVPYENQSLPAWFVKGRGRTGALQPLADLEPPRRS
jgi:hypothetical protein